jgi:hypothetical protein
MNHLAKMVLGDSSGVEIQASHRAQHCIGLGPDTSCRDHFGQPQLDILAAFLSIRLVEAVTLAALAWANHQLVPYLFVPPALFRCLVFLGRA